MSFSNSASVAGGLKGSSTFALSAVEGAELVAVAAELFSFAVPASDGGEFWPGAVAVACPDGFAVSGGFAVLFAAGPDFSPLQAVRKRHNNAKPITRPPIRSVIF